MYPIYCINLEHRTDRKQHTIKEFEKLEIPHNKVIYPHFTKHKEGGLFGCFQSHMKVWNDFFIKYPNQKYCLVFEDDFVISKNSQTTMKNAVEFIEKNYKDIDVLFLHNLRIKIDNPINNDFFTNGFGLTTHSYFITRHYIKSIIKKYGKLPQPNGRHFDFELNQNIFDKDNLIYSEKLFFTNKKCMSQLISNNPSDNKTDIFNFLFSDINKRVNSCKKFGMFVKKYRIMNDDQIKAISYYTQKIFM